MTDDQPNGRDGVGSQEKEEMETESSVYMACILQGHRLGIAYYDNSTGGMHVTETWDSTEGSGDEYPYIQLLMEDGRDFQVKIVKNSAFSYEQAKHSDGYLTLDAATHDALQIFQEDRHPSSMGIGKAKEGFSVFGMLNKISFLMSSQDLVKALNDSLKKIKDVPKILQSLANVVHIRGLLELIVSQRQQDAAAILELQVVRKIFKYVNEELTQVCELLDDLKHQYEGLPDFLNQVAEAELNRIPPGALQECNYTEASILHIPQVGYLMRFEGDKQGQALTDALPDFEFAFEGDDADGHGIFYHTKRTRELGELLGDVYHKILDMENAILRDLEKRVVDSSTNLVQAVDAAAELDWHVLQEMTVDTFVPNDTEIEATGRINVITGPNYSGKSVYVKQVALITFLAHIGSFVPADECTVGLTDRHATARSLCIIDEFGKGTLTADGVGLLCATLKHLASLKAPPKVLVCTHFGEVLDETFLPRSKNVQFSTTSILTEQQPEAQPAENTRGLPKDITFLYRLVKGHAVPSYGVHCAELAGVAPDVLTRASEIIQFIKEGKPIDRLQGNRTVEKDLEYKALVEKLLAFDCQSGDPKEFLKQIFSPAPSVEATASEP
ncbi:putative MutS homolog 5 [Klebsormidium nitens]|uniref:Putative MutS homolog 5 n=1 Tax=Klebsormidium nitens TaxID=105231 RepID=A0A1Y1I5A4_KLENI|nr:putative MutS homolog 5 [Klebsormidium nitens]|eukprot:GAQ86130.1 putative MutS homolog 5 [Klebsormidium nitens]